MKVGDFHTYFPNPLLRQSTLALFGEVVDTPTLPLKLPKNG